MKHARERILNFLRILVWCLDYLIYLIFNPFKFKPLPNNVKNILVIELKYIGDIIVIGPAIKALKNKYKNSSIDIVVPSSMNDLVKHNPCISSILNFDGKTFSQRLDMLKCKYDLAVIFHNGTFPISMLLLLAKVKFRVGCTKVGILEGKGYFLHRNTKPTWILKHKIEDNLDVIKTLDITQTDKELYLHPDKLSRSKMEKTLLKNKVSKKDFLVMVHAKPQHKSHEWSQDRFTLLADKLINEYTAKIVFSGSKKDVDYNNQIINNMHNKAINMAGTSLAEFMALTSMASMVISVDTGAMHVAAALKKPVISLFGAGNPGIWKPYFEKSSVIFKENMAHTSCMKHNCYLKANHHMECMKSISVDDVLKQVKLLKNGR